MSVSAASDRIRRMNGAGVVLANRAVLSPRLAGLNLCAFIFVDLEPRADEHVFAEALRRLLEVREAHHVTGPHSWLLEVRARDASALQHLLANHLKPLPGVLRTETIIALDIVKETTGLALPAADTLARGAVIGFAIATPAGPIGLLCIRRALAQGAAAGIASGVGAAADTVYGLVAALGLSALAAVLVGHAAVLSVVGWTRKASATTGPSRMRATPPSKSRRTLGFSRILAILVAMHRHGHP